jgi:hypothetical protein
MVGLTESEREDCSDFEPVEFEKESGREGDRPFEQIPRLLQTNQEKMSMRRIREPQPIISTSNEPKTGVSEEQPIPRRTCAPRRT